jgi:hypothetical protein
MRDASRPLFICIWLPFLIAIVLLIPVMPPKLPLLSWSYPAPVDVRSCLIVFGFMVSVAVFLSRVKMDKLARYGLVYYRIVLAFFGIQSLLVIVNPVWYQAFTEYFPPGNVTAQVAFPFSNQNTASFFITLSLLGVLGSSVVQKDRASLLIGIPVLGLAQVLTGSRSGTAVFGQLASP